ncbi:MAG TPA: hypothetical protein VFQ44_06465 [Streptosporangiaceae bacterium]|nr:hypothetical protein [Streptosporangiaceae bacterium]
MGETIGRVVRSCGGLPLALRIAGAQRVHDHTRPTAELADRLDRQGLDGLVYGELSVADLHAAAIFSGCGAAYLEMQAMAALARASTSQGDVAGAARAWASVVRLRDAANVPAKDRLYSRPGAAA